jgi:ATP-dependent Clp protease ATP-binding subunit ClpB
MTSNIGSTEILGYGESESPESYERMRTEVMGLLKQSFRPEFLNRLDETVVFRGLDRDQLRRIVSIQVTRVAERLAHRGITLELSDDARDHLAEVGYDPTYGARPLKRAIQRELETELAKRIVAGDIRDGMHVTVDAPEASNGRLQFRTRVAAAA